MIAQIPASRGTDTNDERFGIDASYGASDSADMFVPQEISVTLHSLCLVIRDERRSIALYFM